MEEEKNLNPSDIQLGDELSLNLLGIGMSGKNHSYRRRRKDQKTSF